MCSYQNSTCQCQTSCDDARSGSESFDHRALAGHAVYVVGDVSQTENPKQNRFIEILLVWNKVLSHLFTCYERNIQSELWIVILLVAFYWNIILDHRILRRILENENF